MPKKLLLADDSVTIQRVIELTFADEDVAVTAVGDGRQAIDRLRADRPDIVLADIGMPERDGYDVAAFIKNDPQLAHIPVILLTGAFEPLDEARARTSGCDGVLVKPFEPQMVINRVMELLSSRRAPAAPGAPPDSAPVPRPAAAPVQQPAVTLDQPPAPAPVRSAEAFAAALDASLEPPPESRKPNDPLEAYFDRLDAAFANIGAPGGRTMPAAPEDESDGISELQAPPPQRAPSQGPLTTRDSDLAADPGPAHQPGVGPALQPDFANAFSALLAAEQGGPAPDPALFLAAPPRLGEAEIEQIVQRVIVRLTDDTVRQTVLDTAERLVREEIDRIKRQARTGGSGPQAGR
jgi:CheY-like chemotaxis protein